MKSTSSTASIRLVKIIAVCITFAAEGTSIGLDESILNAVDATRDALLAEKCMSVLQFYNIVLFLLVFTK